MSDDRKMSRIELMKLMADEAETNVDDPAFDTCQSHISEFACAEDKRQLVEAVKKARAQRDEARAELLAYGGFRTAASEHKSVSEVLSARLVTVENNYAKASADRDALRKQIIEMKGDPCV